VRPEIQPMHKIMLIDAVHPEEMRMVITDPKSIIHEFDFTTSAKQQIKGNIYLAKVTRVEPSLQAAFVEYGGGKQGFLPFAEIHTDYYQIPISDRQRLIEEEERAFNEPEPEPEASEEPRREREHRGRRRGRGRDRDRSRSQGEASGEVTAENIVEGEATEISVESEILTEADFAENDATISEAAGILALPSISSDIVFDESDDVQENSDSVPESSEIAATEASSDYAPSEHTQEDQDNDSEAETDKDNPETQEIETLSSEDEIERPRRSPNFSRRYKIQEVIKRNQILLVQVIKEERGNKGVSLTTFMSLAGRYCVLMPNSPRGGGVSRKINTGDDRKRLKSIISELQLPKGMSMIIRTAGSERTKLEIKRDFDYLVKLWNQIRENTLASSAPALIYEESDLIKRSIRDAYTNEIEEVIVDGEEAFKDAKNFMKMLVPSHAARVKLHKGNVPLFYHHNVEEHLLSMSEPVVKLKSGGYIVMNPTEALISIDVNSGRSTGERNIEETAYKTNIEAAQEVARQLRLRDLAGLIVIDFIDMMDGKNRRNVERILKESLRNDRAKIQIGRISPFGLLEMSRQRLRPSISEAMTRTCSHCNGTGLVRSDATVAIHIIRNLEKEAGNGSIEKFRVSLTPSVAVYLLNHMRETLMKLEQTFNLTVEIQIDDALHDGNFRIEKIRGKDRSREREQPQRTPSSVTMDDDEVIETDDAEAAENKPPQRNRERGNDRNRRNDRGDRNRNRPAATTNETGDVAEGEIALDGNNDNQQELREGGESRSSRRRNRNRRRWKGDRENNTVEGGDTQDATSNSENCNDGDTEISVSFSVNEPSEVVAEKPAAKARGGRPARKPLAEKASSDEVAAAPAKQSPAARSRAAIPEIMPIVNLAAPKMPRITPLKTEPELAVLAEKKSEKPSRKGWWQKIIE
jgi:ribonuclease E